MLPALSVLIELQALDSAIDAARKRLADIPVKEKAGLAGVTAATTGLDAAKKRLHDATAARKLVEKDAAAMDARIAKFKEHESSVKTNEEFHALQREEATAAQEKAALEERVLVMLMDADDLTTAAKGAEGVLAEAKQALEALKAQHAKDKAALEAEIAGLVQTRTAAAAGVDKPTLTKYETILKGRKGIAMARMEGELCTACHVKLRPAVATQVRKNEALVACDSCQRILYYIPPAPADAAPTEAVS